MSECEFSECGFSECECSEFGGDDGTDLETLSNTRYPHDTCNTMSTMTTKHSDRLLEYKSRISKLEGEKASQAQEIANLKLLVKIANSKVSLSNMVRS
ncbi:hypothetical protein N7486_009734 [Penicillium sp. IBT 16267x]|nr:hypothetical protein N7486_009734 [Penicillium sp. IBT 16267x]